MATARSSVSAPATSTRRSSSCASAACSTRCSCSHFHLGSQISSIRAVKDALREAGRIYVELYKLGAPLAYLDVGGGLGVDYDGSQTNFPSSMNYTMQEYANDIVYGMMELCDPEGVPHPTLVSESGRALVAHHAVLVVDVLGVGEFRVGSPPRADAARGPAAAAQSLRDPPRRVAQECPRVVPRRARVPRRVPEPLPAQPPLALPAGAGRGPLLGAGHQDPAHHPRAPRGARGARRAGAGAGRHLLLQLLGLPVAARRLGDRPALPGHARSTGWPRSRPAGRCSPTSPAIRTARSSTSSTAATSSRCSSSTPSTGDDYHLGIFLVGAYQEILGDLHNLFGDTNTLHVSLGEDGAYLIEHVLTGDTVSDVLKYVSYDPHELLARVRRAVEVALARQADRAGRLAGPAAHLRAGPGRLHLPRARVRPRR